MEAGENLSQSLEAVRKSYEERINELRRQHGKAVRRCHELLREISRLRDRTLPVWCGEDWKEDDCGSEKLCVVHDLKMRNWQLGQHLRDMDESEAVEVEAVDAKPTLRNQAGDVIAGDEEVPGPAPSDEAPPDHLALIEELGVLDNPKDITTWANKNAKDIARLANKERRLVSDALKRRREEVK